MSAADDFGLPDAPVASGTAVMQAEPKLHAALGASSADRWTQCPGSVALSTGLPDNGNAHSREGTAAHAVAEMALKRNADPDVWLGTTVEGVEVTEDMVIAVRVFVDLVRDLWAAASAHPDSRLWIERAFSLGALAPPAPMFGTSDVVLYDGRERRLYVLDYKHGVGYAVSAKGNRQLRYYGLGAMLDIEKEIGSGKIDMVELAIVQPRAAHAEGTIRRDFLTYAELVDFAFELLEAAHAAMAPGAPRVPGGHCRYCKAAALCPEKLAQAQAIAQIEFANAVALPPAPETLPMATLLEVLAHKDILTKWLAAVEKHVMHELESGRPVKGWKLVGKRAVRKWADEHEAALWLATGGFPPEEYQTTPVLKSPAQIEKMLKAHGEKKPEIPANLIVKESSGYTLAPEYDERPALQAGPTADFGPA